VKFDFMICWEQCSCTDNYDDVL